MSNNEYVAPVNHGVLSATGNLAVGTVGGAVNAVGKTTAWTMGLNVLVGALAGIILAAGGAALFTGSAIAAFTGWPLLITGALATAGSVSGVVSGLVESAFFAPIAALIGGGKGASRTLERVSQEKGAARMMEAQVAMYQAQAAAQGNGASKYNFPAQGSSMNPASARIQNDSVQNFGAMNAPELQRT
jgi:hypothetical protein